MRQIPNGWAEQHWPDGKTVNAVKLFERNGEQVVDRGVDVHLPVSFYLEAGYTFVPLIPATQPLDDAREALAQYAHDAWSGWMRYMFEKGQRIGQFKVGSEGEIEIYWQMPPWAVERWTRQMNTPYAELPEEEKNSDRQEADRMLAICQRAANTSPLLITQEQMSDIAVEVATENGYMRPIVVGMMVTAMTKLQRARCHLWRASSAGAGVYSHRNGETETPTVDGFYWLKSETTSFVRVHADPTKYPFIWGLGVSGFLHNEDYEGGQWWGPVPAPWE